MVYRRFYGGTIGGIYKIMQYIIPYYPLISVIKILSSIPMHLSQPQVKKFLLNKLFLHSL